MSIILDSLLAQAANGSPATVALSSESVAVLLFASGFLEVRENWLDTNEDPLDQVTDADWDTIEKLVAGIYTSIMTPIIGTIWPLVLAAVPPNMLLCDGSTYARSDYPLLYAALDSAFIIDADNFMVPDLQGRTVLGTGTGTGLSTYTPGQVGGQESVILTASQNGVHTHLLNDPGHVHQERAGNGAVATLTSGGGTNVAVASANNGGTSPNNVVQAATGITVQNSAGGSPHENRQPFVALKYAMVAF